MSCEHRTIFLDVKAGPRQPMVQRWACHSCNLEFEPKMQRPPTKLRVWLMTRKFRKQIETMRIEHREP
jgi:transposase-like protein